MSWSFNEPYTVTPQLVQADAPTTEDPPIIETPYTGCAWCGDGDGNGLCSTCEAKYFPHVGGEQ